MESLALSALFAAAVVCSFVLKTWLAWRQMRHVASHRAAVPAAFAEKVPLAAHQKAADYTLARGRFGLVAMAVGTAMDMTPTILILTPVLMPIVKAAGIDPVYFGVLFIMNNAIGLITPPVGTVLNVVAGVGRMKMDEVTRGVLPFMAAQMALMFLMVLFPQIVTVPAKWFAG